MGESGWEEWECGEGAEGEGSKGLDTNCERMIIDLLIAADVSTW
jgi:hypothetical protein